MEVHPKELGEVLHKSESELLSELGDALMDLLLHRGGHEDIINIHEASCSALIVGVSPLEERIIMNGFAKSNPSESVR